MTSIVLETNGSRPRLLEQTLKTLEQNTPFDDYTLTLVADGEIDMSSRIAFMPNNTTLTIEPAIHVTGRLKNLGAYWSEKHFGKSDYICFIDDDIAVQPGWLENMIESINAHPQVRILGGNRHPYHGVNETIGNIEVVDAVAGYCMLMKWHTWATFGPFDARDVGIMRGEDVNICLKIGKAGGKVGYIHPPVLSHTGLTNSVGGKATGADQIKQIADILYL